MDGAHEPFLELWVLRRVGMAQAHSHPRDLTKTWKEFLACHLAPAIERMLEGDPLIPAYDELETVLSQKGHDYEGNSWIVMEQLEVEKVDRCWPEVGKAAVQPLTRFLTRESKERVSTPGSRSSLSGRRRSQSHTSEHPLTNGRR